MDVEAVHKAMRMSQLIAERNNLIQSRCKCSDELKKRGVCECGRQDRLMYLNHEIAKQ